MELIKYLGPRFLHILVDFQSAAIILFFPVHHSLSIQTRTQEIVFISIIGFENFHGLDMLGLSVEKLARNEIVLETKIVIGP